MYIADTIELLLCFSTESKISFHLKDHLSKNAVINAIQAIPYRPGSSNMADGLQTLRTSMFNPANGDREASDTFLRVSALIARSEGTLGTRPSTSRSNFLFHAVFLKRITKIIDWRTPLRSWPLILIDPPLVLYRLQPIFE